MTDWFKIIVNDEMVSEKLRTFLDIAYTEERALLSEWISEFVVKDGLIKTMKQFQITFHDVLWEIYLNKVFLVSKFMIVDGRASPDFDLLKNGTHTFVEAVIANIGLESRKESDRNISDVYAENNYPDILDESIVRISNAIGFKLEIYAKKYQDVVKESPFVVAVGDFGQVNYGQSYYLPMLGVLYNAYFDPSDKRDLLIHCEDNYGREYKYLDRITKYNGSELDLGLFSSDKNSHISAIMYSCTLTLGKLTSLSKNHSPFDKCIKIVFEVYMGELHIARFSGSNSDESIADGLFVFHNPFAKVPLDEDSINAEGVTHVFFDAENSEITIKASSARMLKRRFVAMKDMAPTLIPGFHEMEWLPVIPNGR
ncbi:hypothetical protein SAMN05444165_1951 [Paraburkholderia phenazinium]|uniref:Uncharacterized protein n=2 Tax=Paraburkholderia phenazinium TaxID=60549 RepID=A0A1N6I9G1_9BURK|nr:hypothetical protein SAMN05444165_1951 [Paraburkholderia phenazinium]